MSIELVKSLNRHTYYKTYTRISMENKVIAAPCINLKAEILSVEKDKKETKINLFWRFWFQKSRDGLA